MRHIILTLLCAVIPIVCAAQGDRGVNGVVFDENGAPLADAVIKAVGTDFLFKTNSDGTFVIAIPYYVKSLQVLYPGYFSKALEVDGSYLVFRLQVDKDYAARKARAEAEARAEAQRKAEAEEEARLAAERVAAQEAAAQARAEEAARLAAERKAAQEAAAQARAEEAARLAAERKAAQEAAAQARAEEAARLAAERKAAEEVAAIAKAEKLAERKAINEAYNAKYKNKGFAHALEFSYAFYTGTSGASDVVYKHLGYREYGSLHPVVVTYTFGYRFSNWLSLGIGAGVQYQLVNLSAYGDVFTPLYKDVDKYTPLNIPVFVNAKLYMSRGKCQPLLSLSGGMYAPNKEGLFDVGLGLNMRLTKVRSMFFMISACSTPYGDFNESSAVYTAAGQTSASFKLGFTF